MIEITMNPIEEKYLEIKKEGRLGLMTHIVMGYPNLETTKDLLVIMSEAEVDFIELQIPFSDPLGDGPTIREASAVALAHGLTVKLAFDFIKTMRAKTTVPLLIMTYFNIIYRYDSERFCQDAAAAGITGLIVPDYPLEAESRENLAKYAAASNIILIRFVSLDSDAETLDATGQAAQGFVYCFSNRAVTGGNRTAPAVLVNHLKHLRGHITQPLAVGFGLTTSADIAALRGQADIAIVGSALIRAWQAGGNAAVKVKLSELKSALSGHLST